MEHKKRLINIAFLLFGLTVSAQETSATAGGEATGTGGTSSYSVGQVVYTTASGSNGSVSQGVQQPFDVSVITDISTSDIQLNMSAYPNPTLSQLTLEVEEFDNMNFQLSDVNGSLLKSGEITGTNTSIDMEDLPQAIYFLHVMNNNDGIIKTFKVIKQ